VDAVHKDKTDPATCALATQTFDQLDTASLRIDTRLRNVLDFFHIESAPPP
jgi:hypothetical protein